MIAIDLHPGSGLAGELADEEQPEVADAQRAERVASGGTPARHRRSIPAMAPFALCVLARDIAVAPPHPAGLDRIARHRTDAGGSGSLAVSRVELGSKPP